MNGEYAFERLHGCCFRVELCKWDWTKEFAVLFTNCLNKSKVKGSSVGLFDKTILAPVHPTCFYILCREAADVEKVRLPRWTSARWPSYASSSFSLSCFSFNSLSVSYSKGYQTSRCVALRRMGFWCSHVQSSHFQVRKLFVFKVVCFLQRGRVQHVTWNKGYQPLSKGHEPVTNIGSKSTPKEKFPPISRSNRVRCSSNDSSSLITVHSYTWVVPNNPLPHLCPSYPLSHLFSNPNLSGTPCTLLNHQPSVRPLCLTW